MISLKHIIDVSLKKALHINLVVSLTFILKQREGDMLLWTEKKMWVPDIIKRYLWIYECINAVVKQHRLNTNVYLNFLLKPHKTMRVKELREKKITRTKRQQTTKVTFWNQGNSLTTVNSFRLEKAVIQVCWGSKPESQSFSHKTMKILRDCRNWCLPGRCAKNGAENWSVDWTSLKEKLDFPSSLSTLVPSRENVESYFWRGFIR